MSRRLRLLQPLHRELDIGRLNLSPALDLGLVALLWVPLEVFSRQLSSEGQVAGELFSDRRDRAAWP
jgi:hypothetical protein